MEYKGTTDEHLQLYAINAENADILQSSGSNDLSLVWFTEGGSRLRIDGQVHTFDADRIVCLTEFHRVQAEHISSARLLRFNRSFYCIVDHDSEVGCKGILFFGASQLPLICIPDTEKHVFETVYEMFLLELGTKDNLQLEMLQMMLKRFLILCARVYKNQSAYRDMIPEQSDIVREFNYLVEKHFKTLHNVADYAALLHRSPKTLSNVFARISDKTPLQYIQNRRLLEAKRLLRYSDSSIKEIAYAIGFEDIQTFSRFFKNLEQKSPSEYREQA